MGSRKGASSGQGVPGDQRGGGGGWAHGPGVQSGGPGSFRPDLHRQKQGGTATRLRRQLTARRQGSEQVNTFCLNLKKVRVDGFYPSQDIIDMFLLNCLSVEAKKIYSILHQRAKQNVLLSYINEADVEALEKKINEGEGVNFPDTACRVLGFRVDKPTVSAVLTGAPYSPPILGGGV